MWTIELDTFTAMTPDKEQVEFSNIIATLNPKATRRVVLACHYDSKKQKGFIGATDSAVPCAILLDIAKDFQQQLAQRKRNTKYPTLQLIFFDGEEAVRSWTSTDSLYGSRHLAAKMHSTNVLGQQNLSQISAMDVFVLLDLIGDKSLKFVNFAKLKTENFYNQLQDIETQLLHSYDNNVIQQPLFSSNIYINNIEDDHIPFLKHDVPIVHLISSPFPPTWHRNSDDENHLDFPTINRFRNIIKIFVRKNLHLKKQLC
ncbi:hypothetical protein I4U23_013635 [Adineta vaga]|nr:hypothetical protein I4U23_013635 [Adineta vaga]